MIVWPRLACPNWNRQLFKADMMLNITVFAKSGHLHKDRALVVLVFNRLQAFAPQA